MAITRSVRDPTPDTPSLLLVLTLSYPVSLLAVASLMT